MGSAIHLSYKQTRPRASIFSAILKFLKQIIITVPLEQSTFLTSLTYIYIYILSELEITLSILVTICGHRYMLSMSLLISAVIIMTSLIAEFSTDLSHPKCLREEACLDCRARFKIIKVPFSEVKFMINL